MGDITGKKVGPAAVFRSEKSAVGTYVVNMSAFLRRPLYLADFFPGDIMVCDRDLVRRERGLRHPKASVEREPSPVQPEGGARARDDVSPQERLP